MAGFTEYAVPNVSEGKDAKAIAASASALSAHGEVLDRHSDGIHNRTVFNLTAPPGALVTALAAGARACIEQIDMRAHSGAHPSIGALDVCPVIWLSEAQRQPAQALAREVANALAMLDLPVFLYGTLASEPNRSERAYFRRGGFAALSERMASGELVADLGPAVAHPSAGAVMVTARPPLAAFNVELDSGDVEIARAVTAEVRESGGGLEGVRAIGIDLDGVAQISTNVHDPIAVTLGAVVERIRALAAARGARPVAAELVGLVPQAALRDLPPDVPLRDFDPDIHVIEARVQTRPAGGR